MKKLCLAVAVAMAIPSLAHAAEPEKKPCCCEKKEGEKGCCDKDKMADHGEHADHMDHQKDKTSQ